MRRFESLRQSRETTGLRSARSRFGRLAIVRRGSRVYGRGRVQIRASTRCQGGGIRGRVGRRVNWGVEARRDRGTDAQRNVLWASVPWSLRAFAHFEQDADSCACGNRRLGLQAGTRRNRRKRRKPEWGSGLNPKVRSGFLRLSGPSAFRSSLVVFGLPSSSFAFKRFTLGRDPLAIRRFQSLGFQREGDEGRPKAAKRGSGGNAEEAGRAEKTGEELWICT